MYQGVTRRLIGGLHTKETLAGIATCLATVADHAHGIRRFEVVGCASQLLFNLPLPGPFEHIAHYYEALSLNRSGFGDTAQASVLFEQAANNGPFQYRARALAALGTNSFDIGDYETAAWFYREVLRILARSKHFEPVAIYTALGMMALIAGMRGDHQGAVADLEKLFPIARLTYSKQPDLYYDYLNALAVELGEVGRLAQARWASEIASASPFAMVYPNWPETYGEIDAKQRRASRSFVAVRPQVSAIHNLVRLTAPEPAGGLPLTKHLPKDSPARVFNFQQWKTILKGPNVLLPKTVTADERKRMTTGQKLIRLMDLISQDETREDMIDKILEAVEEIVLNRRDEKLD
ncbi:MAG: hypothetical protein WAV20_18590 [Blastocatellia bacterium]